MNKTKMRKRMIWMLLGVGLFFGALFAYQMFGAYMMKKYLASNGRPPATVTAMTVDMQEWQANVRAIGSLRAVQGVNISPEVAGQVVRVAVSSGQRVKQDQLLLELNHADDDAQLASFEADAVLAGIQFERDKAQLAARATSQAVFDASRAALARATAAVSRQKALIAKKRIRAPFAGRLGIMSVNPGQYLHAADVVSSLQNSASLFVDFSLPQKAVGGIKSGQLMHVHSDAWPGQVFEGRITAVNAEVDAATRNVRIEGRIENPGSQLTPGMFVSLTVQRGQVETYLTLPQTAVSYNAYGATVFIAEKASGSTDAKPVLVAQQEFVKLGPTRGDQVAVLSGIKAGDMIVTSGLMKLKNGTPLIIDNHIQPANDVAPQPQEH
ncbi:MAG: efflux RND transporter periplasmic adaptor subunit [Mariprofundaceae bacterium]|nr:efflux RND transporter periplasmic adaptor subunit [Mariprofundaceae bacterium]